MVLEAAEPGPLRFTNDGAEDWAILSVWVVVDARRGIVSYAQERPCRYGLARGRGSVGMGCQGLPLCM